MQGPWGREALSWSERIEWHREVETTMALARARAASGAPTGTSVIAERQTGGRGRRGRDWFSPPGGLYASTILWPRANVAPGTLVTASLMAGVATWATVRQLGGHTAWLKWPNDIWAEGRKLAGILCELDTTGQGPVVLVGIGINLLGRREAGVPSALGTTYVGLADLLNASPPALKTVAHTLLQNLQACYSQWEKQGPVTIVARVREADGLCGKRVRVDTGQDVFYGQALGIDDAGCLQVQTRGGCVSVLAADVHRVGVGDADPSLPQQE